MNGTATALCAAISIGSGDQAPEWLHLLPAGEARTVDGRGPFRVTDVPAMLAATMRGGKLILDENHATDLAAPQGHSAPACGWITEVEQRDDGTWGRVDWTPAALNAQIWRGYRGVSPAINHRRDGTVTSIARASLTNLPNLTGLTSLHMKENGMDFRGQLLEALGLGSDADDTAIIATVSAMKDAGAPPSLNAIAKAVGVAEDADEATVLAGVQSLKSGGDDRVATLQGEVTSLNAQLKTITDQQSRDKATAFVDAAIAAGRVGVKPARDEYISMHMTDPARAKKLVDAMPILTPGTRTMTVVPADEAATENPTLLAQKATAYQRKMAADGVTITIATAVRAVQEGKAA